jgi:hypothetical protein
MTSPHTKLTRNSLTTYELTPSESHEGQILGALNYCVIQNLKAQYVEEKLNLLFDPEHPLKYAQQEAYLSGQIDVLNYILSSHEEALAAKMATISTD